jgi:hypothetical protein
MREEPIGELQALVTGALIGALMRQDLLLVDVQPSTDEGGFLPEFIVVGRESGQRLRVRIEELES